MVFTAGVGKVDRGRYHRTKCYCESTVDEPEEPRDLPGGLTRGKTPQGTVAGAMYSWVL